jgi:hypothetical protein
VERAKREAIAQVFDERQDLVRCIANEKQIIDLISRWTNYSESVLPSKAIFDQVLLENPNEIKNFVRRPLEKIKQQLIEEILALLKTKGKNHDEFSLRKEGQRLALLSVPELRARLATLEANAKMAATPLSEHRKTLQDASAKYARTTYGYPTLPDEFTAERLKSRSFPSSELKKLLRLYGNDQLLARLNGQS